MIRFFSLCALFFALSAQAAVDFSGNWKGVGMFNYCASIQANYWECHTPLEGGSCPLVEINITQTATELTLAQDFSKCPMRVLFQPPSITFSIVNGELFNQGVLNGTVGDTLKIAVDRCQFSPGCTFPTSEQLEIVPNTDGTANLRIHGRGPNAGSVHPHYYGISSQLIR